MHSDDSRGRDTVASEAVPEATDSDNPAVDVSIVYINRGMGDLLLRSLFSLAEAAPSCSLEVIVAQCPGRDAPDLQKRAEAAFPGLRWIEHPEFGIARLRNVGIAAARGRYVTMLDADTLVRSGCFERILEFMDAHPEAAGCGPRTIRPDGQIEYSAKRFYTFWTIVFRRTILGRLWPNSGVVRRHLLLDFDHAQPLDIDWMAGACYVMRAEAIRHIGNFDESFFFGFEDVDWCYRAKGAGWKICFVPDAEIVHDVQRSSARGFNRMALEHLKSGYRFWRKHLRTPRPDPPTGELSEPNA